MSEKPADFIAANSYLSEKLPYVIIDAIKTVNGRIKGINFGV